MWRISGFLIGEEGFGQSRMCLGGTYSTSYFLLAVKKRLGSRIGLDWHASQSPLWLEEGDEAAGGICWLG